MNIPHAIRNRNAIRLFDIVPELRAVAARVLQVMEDLGYPMLVTDGARTAAQQFALYQQGRILRNGVWVKVGATVTNADGTTNLSNHQIKPDGFGYAVDMAFLIDGADRDGEFETPTWDAERPWQLYGVLAETLGRNHLTWGGRWSSLRDLPHIEWRK